MLLNDAEHNRYAHEILERVENGSHIVTSERKFLWKTYRRIVNAADPSAHEKLRRRIDTNYHIFGNGAPAQAKKMSRDEINIKIYDEFMRELRERNERNNADPEYIRRTGI